MPDYLDPDDGVTFYTTRDGFYTMLLKGPAILACLGLVAAFVLWLLHKVPIEALFFILAGTIGFTGWAWMVLRFTRYVITRDRILVYFGFFRLREISISRITHMDRKWGGGQYRDHRLYGLGAKAISIKHDNGRQTAITPKNEKEFVSMILEKNPDIEVFLY